jgi:hypothetical protein
MSGAQVLTVAITAGSGLMAAVAGLLWAAHVYKRQTNAQILLECSKRYDDIVAACPPEAWVGRLDPNHPPPENPLTTQAVLRYLNLRDLELYLWRQRYFSEGIWDVWGRMLANTLKGALLRREWPRLRQDFVSDPQFTSLVDDLQSPAGIWTHRRLTWWQRLKGTT